MRRPQRGNNRPTKLTINKDTSPSPPTVPSNQERAVPVNNPQRVSAQGVSNLNKQRILTTQVRQAEVTAPQVDKYKDLSPLERIGTGVQNQVTDYQGIVNWDHKSESVLNQSIEKAFVGDWDGAGKVIRENPYRFAGNLAVEVGSALIPATWGLKAAKYGAQTVKTSVKASQLKRVSKNVKNLEAKSFAVNKNISDELPIVAKSDEIDINSFSQRHTVPDYKGGKEIISEGQANSNLELMLRIRPEVLPDSYWFRETISSSGKKIITPIRKTPRPLSYLKGNREEAIETQVLRFGKLKGFVESEGRILDSSEMQKVLKPFKTEQKIISPGSRLKYGSESRQSTMTQKMKNSVYTMKNRRYYRQFDQKVGKADMFGLPMKGYPVTKKVERIVDIVKNKVPSRMLIKPGKTLEGPYKVDDYGTRPVQQTFGQKTLNVLRKRNLIDDRQTVEGISLINTKSNVFRFLRPNEYQQSLGITAAKSGFKQDEIIWSQAGAATTPKRFSETLKHEGGHSAIDHTRGVGAKAQREAMDASSGWDRLLYLSEPHKKHNMLSTLNQESYTMAEIKKMNPDKLDLLMREQNALGNTNTFSTGNNINWKKSPGQEIRRTDDGELLGMSRSSTNSIRGNNKSQLFNDRAEWGRDGAIPKKSASTRDSETYDTLKKQHDSNIKKNTELNRKVNFAKDVLTDSFPYIGITVVKGYQFFNQAEKTNYQKNKRSTRLKGRYM